MRLIPLKNQSGQLVNFQGADLQEEKDGKLVWALSAEKIEYDPRTKAIVSDQFERSVLSR